MTQSEYIRAVEKLNAQTTKEWDAFLDKHGPIENYDQLSDEGKLEAITLADRQGTRLKRLDDKFNPGQP